MHDVLDEFDQTRPLVQRQIDWLTRRGVNGLHIAKRWDGQYDFIQTDEVVFFGDGFEFARHVKHPGQAVGAFVFTVWSHDGEAIDLCAWRPPEVATWLSRAVALGQEQILGPRLDDPLPVHQSVISWFAAGRRGIYVLQPGLLAPLVQNETLGVISEGHARELRTALTIPAPPIVVIDQAELAA